MTVSHFSNALGEIDTRYISEAATFRRKRRSWPKWTVIAACLAILLMVPAWLFGRPQETALQYGVNSLIPADVTRATVTHTIAGQAVEYHFTGAELNNLRTWADALDYTPMDTPEEYWYGAEVYNFSFDGQAISFSYIGAGDTDWFLVMDGRWYMVSNPSRPLPNIIDGHQWSSPK